MKQAILKVTILIFMLFISLAMCFNWYFRFNIEKDRFVEDSESMFYQIDNIIKNNDAEIDDISDEFSKQCLIKAKAAAYMISNNSEARFDMLELKSIAELLSIDEIHIFTSDGFLYAGTHPKYFGYTFESGDQMKFFLPMLDDISLTLCQNITPNTAEGNPMQYAAAWNNEGTEIVQIGLSPERVLEAKEGNTISKVFTMMPMTNNQDFLAINPETFIIEGSTKSLEFSGLSIEDIGITEHELSNISEVANRSPRELEMYGIRYFALLHKTDKYIIASIVPRDIIVDSVTLDTIILAGFILIFSIIATAFISTYPNKRMIESIDSMNKVLAEIGDGNLTLKMDNTDVPELNTLSDHINSMVENLVNQTHKLSITMDLAKIPVGIVEFNSFTQKITVTGKIQEILNFSTKDYNLAILSPDAFKISIEDLVAQNTLVEDNILNITNTDKYIKMERFEYFGSTLVLFMDVSKEILSKKTIEHERDTDLLTGIYNRRAYYTHMDEIVKTLQTPHMAACIVDIDNLKYINDIYGHLEGDEYIKNIVNIIDFEGDFIASRFGGDEFTFTLYNAPDLETLQSRIQSLVDRQDAFHMTTQNGDTITLAFSIGYAFSSDEISDYQELNKLADKNMYENKCQRKKDRTVFERE